MMRQKSKWFLSVLLAAALMLGVMSSAAAEEAPAPAGKHITLLHTNDMHARAVE